MFSTISWKHLIPQKDRVIYKFSEHLSKLSNFKYLKRKTKTKDNSDSLQVFPKTRKTII